MYRTLCCGENLASCSRRWAVREVVEMGSGMEEAGEEAEPAAEVAAGAGEGEEEEGEGEGMEVLCARLAVMLFNLEC